MSSITDEQLQTQDEESDTLDRSIAGLDAISLAQSVPRLRRTRRAWSATWPKLAAIALALGIWQLLVWSGWKPTYVLPPPAEVFRELWQLLLDGSLQSAVSVTLRRAAIGFSIAIAVGVLIGAPVSQIKGLRTAVGSMITGLQTMPSIAWFPLAILLFKISEAAILFVVVLGAAPAIANGLISGADNIPPILRRAAKVLGASGPALYREVILPGSMPSFVAGLKQGWAFAWRSLMAGELLVIIANKASLGVQLQVARDFNDSTALLAVMIVIFVIGVLVDSLIFGTLERSIRRRRGLIDGAA
ncbi:MAG: ABC transporter permease [Actinobacteria bacterium]|nr:ABC transporter permease [Actinomycetota bacterium]